MFITGCKSEEQLAINSGQDHKVKSGNIKPYPGKPHAAVEMHYKMKKNIAAGETIDVTMTFINTKNVDDLEISYKLDDGLTSSEALHQYNFGVLAASEKSVVTLPITATNDGYYYIYVVATLIDDKRQSRSFAIALNVGNVKAHKHIKSNGKVTIDSSGRRVISMPAQMKKKER